MSRGRPSLERKTTTQMQDEIEFPRRIWCIDCQAQLQLPISLKLGRGFRIAWASISDDSVGQVRTPWGLHALSTHRLDLFFSATKWKSHPQVFSTFPSSRSLKRPSRRVLHPLAPRTATSRPRSSWALEGGPWSFSWRLGASLPRECPSGAVSRCSAERGERGVIT